MKNGWMAMMMAVAMAGCASSGGQAPSRVNRRVQVPPRLVLDKTQTLGIVDFVSEGEHAGRFRATAQFIEAVQRGQPGVAIVELGAVKDVSPAALRALGQKNNLNAIFAGTLILKKGAPKVDMDLNKGLSLGAFRAQVRVDGTLTAKLVEASRGATLWSGSSARWINVAQVTGSDLGAGSLSLPDTQRQYEKLVHDMVQEIAADFQPRWEFAPQ
jgi:hypothetical protein